MEIIPHRPDIKQAYSNPFKDKNIYPFNKIGRVACNKDTGEIICRLHDIDSNLDLEGFPVNIDNLDIYTYIPKFYSKRVWNGETVVDSISTEVPTEKVKGDWEIHPAFIRPDGTIRPYILIGSFKGVDIGGQLRSVPNLSKPLVSITIATALSKARQGRSNNFTIECPQVLTAMWILCKVAFQTLNLQQYVGRGWVNKNESAQVGTTMSLGNRTGYVGVDGDQISIFGVEDFYGNIWSFITGIYATDEGYRITNDQNKFNGDASQHDLVATTPLMGSGANNYVEGYIKKIHKIDGTHKYWNIAKELGGTDSTYYTDYFWSHRRSQTNICLFGTNWDDSLLSGAFCLSFVDVASRSWSSVGSRLCYLP